MKKSKLRKIIRESIKELMTEQNMVNCDQSAWSNYNNWVNTFTSLPHFNSSNPNQPCTMLCKKMNNWITKLQTEPGPNFRNQLQCKLTKVQQLMMQYGPGGSCNC